MGALSVLSVCNAGVLLQTVGWIKMLLGTEVGIGPDHIVLDGKPAPRKGHSSPPPTFRPISIVAKRSPISTAELLSGFSWRSLIDITFSSFTAVTNCAKVYGHLRPSEIVAVVEGIVLVARKEQTYATKCSTYLHQSDCQSYVRLNIFSSWK